MIKQAVRPAHKSKTIEIKSNGQTSTPDRPAPNCNPVFVVTAVTVASDYDISSVCYVAKPGACRQGRREGVMTQYARQAGMDSKIANSRLSFFF